MSLRVSNVSILLILQQQCSKFEASCEIIVEAFMRHISEPEMFHIFWIVHYLIWNGTSCYNNMQLKHLCVF